MSMELFFVIGLVAVVAAGVLGFILGKKSVQIPDVQARLMEQKLMFEQQLATVKESNEKQIEALKLMNREQVESQMKLIREQMQTTSEKVLRMREEQLGQTNREQVSKIMDPLNETFRQMKEQMQKMEESVQKVNTDSAERKASITQTIEALAKETMKVGEQAGDLAKALKNKSKVQGDWGEQVLENILEGSGLRKDEDYYTQYNVKGEGNANFRPDVVVKCPGDKSIVIDSKVSLTAYLDYVAADDPDSQKRAARENLASIRKHIDELSAKNYEKLVGNTISHVLMFIPNEGSYILALQTDPKIAQHAFSKNVLLINPTNLMMSLKLIYNNWQSERQTRNVENIVAESTGLYEKFAGFLETFTDVGTKIQSLQKAFDTAENQLCTGKGNVVRRIEGLKEKGILPKKSLPDKYLNKARE
jgi:DNA recombination protein RmuC